MKGKQRSGIAHALARMTVLPILFLGIIIGIFGVIWTTSSMEKEVKNELTALSNAVYSSFDSLFLGDFSISETGADLTVSKGEKILNYDYEYLDSMKAETDADYTLFVEDLRVLTTLTDENGTRLTGTIANDQVRQTVYQEGQELFYRKVNVLGKYYFAYYMPVYNSDGSIAGMFATVIPRSRVISLVARSVLPLLLLIAITAVLAIFWSFYNARDFKTAIARLNTTFQKVSSGQLSNTVDSSLLARKDEFGQMSHAIVDMQADLRRLVEEDMLTGLVNRRSGQQRLEAEVEKHRGSEKSFCLALGDIDFFKKFNDTYGHDCGDLVLKHIAQLLQHQIRDYGVCSRWGGEEFLIIFKKGSLEECTAVMEELIEAIRSSSVTYEGLTLSVTMTFGLIDCNGLDNWDDMVKKVDNLLYEGKEGGRNRLVVD